MMIRMIALAAASTAALAAATPAAAAQNLLTNGSFELGSDGLQGWTVDNTNSPANAQGNEPIRVITYNTATSATYGESIAAPGATGNPGLDAAGTHGVYFVSDNARQSLSQTVTLQAGKSYTFGFDIYKTVNGAQNAGNATFTATLGGTQFASFNTSGLLPTTGVWQTYSGANSFTSTQSGSFAFNFITSGFPSKDFVVDRVYLTETGAVPEPATWAMMFLGFGLVGAAVRRSRTIVAHAVSA